MSLYSLEPRSRTVVTPDSSVRRAFSCARKTVSDPRRARSTVPPISHVRVHVDQPRQAGVRAQIRDRGALGDRGGAGTDAHDTILLNHDHGIPQRAAGAVDERAESDRPDLGRKRRRDCGGCEGDRDGDPAGNRGRPVNQVLLSASTHPLSPSNS